MHSTANATTVSCSTRPDYDSLGVMDSTVPSSDLSTMSPALTNVFNRQRMPSIRCPLSLNSYSVSTLEVNQGDVFQQVSFRPWAEKVL
ncbi:unnamed protein product [Protopolystoma xenopodis]|uniref:Uncharacterized protein n=1 Tax=Protopolystoma xenopodis TaxID=117903 RepID=A0A3S5CGK5_9PLAT|nr:unnamed protein product [Protopolystoma xenopodis]